MRVYFLRFLSFKFMKLKKEKIQRKSYRDLTYCYDEYYRLIVMNDRVQQQ